MRILQLCKKFPWPLKDGEAIACTYLAEAYHQLGHEVDLLSMNTSKHWFDLAQLPADFKHYQRIETVFVDNRIRPLPALLNLFTDKSYHIERFENEDFDARLVAMLKEKSYDMVQVESIYLAPYVETIRKYSSAKIVLRAHNVEFEIWERVAEQSGFLKRWYLNTITPRLKRYELKRINEFDLVASITQRDLDIFRKAGLKKPATVTPIGMDSRRYQPDMHSFQAAPSLSFIGSLDWMPNQDGLRWFLDEVWQPLVHPAFPDLTFHIAGRTAPSWLRELRMEGVIFHGEVPDAADFLNQHSIMVVPLLSGSGMRAKILESTVLSRVVISTDVGMEGIPMTHLENCLLANTPDEWVEALRYCLEHPEKLSAIGERARAFCLKNFDHIQVAAALIEQVSKPIEV